MTSCADSNSRQSEKRSRSMRHDSATRGAPTRKTTCRAGSNIAFIKYWGVADSSSNIPLNNSISMTLADAHTTTTVAWDDNANLATDTISIDGAQLQGAPAARIVAHLDRLRALAGVSCKARVVSQNNFPMASGIASSASGFAALTVAASAALGLPLDAAQLSALARQASGSASRSLFGGFVEWRRGWGEGESEEEKGEREGQSLLDSRSVAHQMHDESHWALRDLIAIVSVSAKRISSSDGHRLAATSPFTAARTHCVERLAGNRAPRRRRPRLRPARPGIGIGRARHARRDDDQRAQPALLAAGHAWRCCTRCGRGARRRACRSTSQSTPGRTCI